MLATVSRNVADYLARELNLGDESREIIQYAVKLVISSVAGLVAIGLVGLLLNVLKPTLAAALVAATIRSFSGGAHLSRPGLCVAAGAVVFPLLGLLAKFAAPLMEPPHLGDSAAVGIILSIYCLFRWAPADSPGKPIQTIVHRKKLKRLSLVFAVLVSLVSTLAWYGKYIDSTAFLAAVLGLLWQSLTLSPTGYLVAKGFDNLRLPGLKCRKKGGAKTKCGR